MKKMFSSLIVGVLFFGCLSVGGSASFTDIESHHYHYDSIMWMKNTGIVEGYADGTFGVGRCANRAEFLKILYETRDQSVDLTPSADFLFTDVPGDAWYSPYVRLAKEEGLVHGYGDGSFRPANCISRAEAVKVATLSFNNGVVPEFPADFYYLDSAAYYGDITEHDWFYGYLDYALKANLISDWHISHVFDWTGMDEFFPNEQMPRDEVAEMFYRFRTVTDNEKNSYSQAYSPILEESQLFYNNCVTDGSDLATVESNVLRALPKNSPLVAGMNFNDNSALAATKKIVAIFEDSDEVDDFEYFDLFFVNDWEVAVGLDINADDEVEVVIAGKFGNAERFEDFAKDTISKNMNWHTECEVIKGITYWTNDYDDLYFARYGDFFLLSNVYDLRARAVTDLRERSGFVFEDNFNENKLAYSFVDKSFLENIKDVFQDEFGTTGAFSSGILSALGSVGDFYGYLKDDGSGFVAKTYVEILDSIDPFIKPYFVASPSLVGKIPGEKMIFYSEDVNFSLVLNGIDEFLQMFLLQDEGIVKYIAEDMGIDYEDALNLFASPYALSVSEGNSVLPSFAFYLDFDSSAKSTAEAFVSWMDEYIDDLLEDNGKSVTNSGLHKIAVDEFGFETEIYYGIMNDNVLVFAIYPDFESHSSSSSLSQQSMFKEAVGKLNGVYGGELLYMNFSHLVSQLDNLSDSEWVEEDELTSLKDVLGKFRYLISSTKARGGMLESIFYLRVN